MTCAVLAAVRIMSQHRDSDNRNCRKLPSKVDDWAIFEELCGSKSILRSIPRTMKTGQLARMDRYRMTMVPRLALRSTESFTETGQSD